MNKWQRLEDALSGVFGSAKAKADGHELTFSKALHKEKLVVQVFVDGCIKGAWTEAKDGKPVHPEAKFWRPYRSRAWPLKKHAALKRAFGKKRADEMTTLKVVAFMPSFGSPRSLVRHLKKHFPDLKLVESESEA